jgi:hypothetical protein
MKRIISLAVVIGLSLAALRVNATDLGTSTLSCPKGEILGIYNQPREGTIPWYDKYVRCEKIDCPWGMKPSFYDTEVYGSQPVDGSFVRCDDAFVPSAGKPELPSGK